MNERVVERINRPDQRTYMEITQKLVVIKKIQDKVEEYI